MSDNGREVPWLGRDYIENRAKQDPEALRPYLGKHIAWSWDGKRVVASGATPEELEQNLIAAGEDPTRVVWQYLECDQEG